MKRFFEVIRTVWICLVWSLVTGCEGIDAYLDKAPSGGLTENQVFGNYQQALQFLAGIYQKLPNEWLPAGSETFTYAAASDEALCSVQLGNGPQEYTNGLITPTNNVLDVWLPLYTAVRSANLFLEKIALWQPQSAVEEEAKNRMIGEAHFLRAFFYMELFKRYGGVPLISRTLNITGNMNLPRNSTDETVTFIVSDCEKAAGLLPAKHTSVNEGRPTKGAALMLKARVLLYRASPLHNPSGDKSWWRRAEQAAGEVIASGGYAVDSDYKGLFHRRNTPNLIFQSTGNQTAWRNLMFIPGLGGYARIQPLENLVQDYEMKATGLSVDDPASGFDPASPYEGRDPRLGYSVIFDGAVWKGATIRTYVGAPGTNGMKPEGGAPQTQTGYYLAKTVDENASVTPAVSGEHYWVYMRYEDVLLMFAEARNEVLEGPDEQVYEAVNEVRTRAGIGMPPLLPGLSREAMRERIRHERRIELAFEGQRFWDIRRWRIGMETMTEARGTLIEQLNGELVYRPNRITERTYKPAFDLFPIPQTELEKQRALVQNPDYN